MKEKFLHVRNELSERRYDSEKGEGWESGQRVGREERGVAERRWGRGEVVRKGQRKVARERKGEGLRKGKNRLKKMMKGKEGEWVDRV